MKRPLIRGKRAVLQKRPIASAVEQSGGLYFASEKKNLKFIRTGCLLLDLALGGGWVLGRMCNIIGDKSTGKTLLAMEAIANFFMQYPNGWCKYKEAEGAFDADYARALGIPIDRVSVESIDTVEDMITEVKEICEKDKVKGPGLYIIDSFDGLSDEAEMKSDISDGTYGMAKQKMISRFFRQYVRQLNKRQVCLMIISQVRENINAMAFGEKYRRAGGKALDFYASHALWLAHIKLHKRQINKIERAWGVRILAKCKKNKVDMPFREAEFDIKFGYGIDDAAASMDFLKDAGVLARPNLTKEELDALVRETWVKIEKNFMPGKPKYALAVPA